MFPSAGGRARPDREHTAPVQENKQMPGQKVKGSDIGYREESAWMYRVM